MAEQTILSGIIDEEPKTFQREFSLSFAKSDELTYGICYKLEHLDPENRGYDYISIRDKFELKQLTPLADVDASERVLCSTVIKYLYTKTDDNYEDNSPVINTEIVKTRGFAIVNTAEYLLRCFEKDPIEGWDEEKRSIITASRLRLCLLYSLSSSILC